MPWGPWSSLPGLPYCSPSAAGPLANTSPSSPRFPGLCCPQSPMSYSSSLLGPSPGVLARIWKMPLSVPSPSPGKFHHLLQILNILFPFSWVLLAHACLATAPWKMLHLCPSSGHTRLAPRDGQGLGGEAGGPGEGPLPGDTCVAWAAGGWSPPARLVATSAASSSGPEGFHSDT